MKANRNFSYIPKITDAHVRLSPFGGKMKVKFASQILSRSVSKALELMRIEGKIDKNSFATEKFRFKMNTLFDILNSLPSQRKRTPFHQELRVGNEAWEYLSHMKLWIQEWKIFRENIVTARFRFVQGWIQAINGITELLKVL